MSKIIRRELTDELLLSASEYPVVTVIGPRQSGKTTLVRSQFPKHGYANLENPEWRELAQRDPKAFLARFPPPVIFDEIQRVPSLLSWIQVLADEQRGVKGQWILTGSNQLQLRESVTQSLAGRTALLTLLPLSLQELEGRHDDWTYAEWIHCGFLPRIYDQGIRPLRAWRDYYQTYVERDVRQLIALENQLLFERFVKLLAGRVGQLINLSSMSGEVGVSLPTLGKWLSILEASFVIFRLPPYHRNFGKRLNKSAKLYFTDPGLAAYLLGIENPAQLERDPLVGGLFENLVVVEALKSRTHRGHDPNLYFFRDHNGKEVDLLYPDGNEVIPVEIKSAQTFDASFAKGIYYFQKLSQSNRAGRIIYSGDTEFASEHYEVRNFKSAFTHYGVKDGHGW
jgi:predicted AAA+ superfamily ATPase